MSNDLQPQKGTHLEIDEPATSPPPDLPLDPFLQVAEQLHDLFLEYRDTHGYDEETAWAKAQCEYLDAKQCPPPPAPPADWSPSNPVPG